ncbi:hypothetical protein M8J75_015550 [Diaphorina citri]|nr:hypothetical protein M8J75_015550 [Diaphorina citri]
MNVTSPVKNIFLTLYLLNNTFNENLFYDRETQMKQFDVTGRKYPTKPEDQVVASDTQNRSVNLMKTLPLLQIPPSWTNNVGSLHAFLSRESWNDYLRRYKQPSLSKGHIKSFSNNNNRALKVTFRKKSLGDDDQGTNPGMESKENGELTRLNNETIINQKNFFIILPESTVSPTKRNYSQTLNQIAKGGQGAINKLSGIVKSKINKTTTMASTFRNKLPDSAQEVLDRIQMNSSGPTCILHEGTTFIIIPDSKTIFTTPHPTKEAFFNLLNTTQMFSAASLLNNMKHNISEKYAKANKGSSTTSKLNTQKIIIPSTFDGKDNSFKPTIQTMLPRISKRPNNSTKTVPNVLSKNKTNATTNNPMNLKTVEISFRETTCFPVLRISDMNSSTMKVIMMNHLQEDTKKISNRSTTETKSPEKSTSPTISQTHQSPTDEPSPPMLLTPSTTVTISPSPLSSPVTESTSLESSPETTLSPKRKKEPTKITTEKRAETSTENFTIAPEQKQLISGTAELPLDYDYEEEEATTESDSNELATRNLKQHHTNLKINMSNNLINSETTKQNEEATTNINDETIMDITEETSTNPTTTRRQKLTTQMLQQKIFSPTSIECGKQRKSSVLVIKLISERPCDLEDQVRQIKQRRLKHRPTKDNKIPMTNFTLF